MRRCLMAVLGVFLLSPLGVMAREPEPKAAGWLTDYKEARDLARRTGKPIFLVFR